jgi:FtsP/CotA-like multicopper oxidase with cupredoxin domain
MTFDRRRLMSILGLGGASLTAVACARPAPRPQLVPISAADVRATAAVAGGQVAATGQSTTGHAANQTGGHTSDDMDAMHAKGVKAFPAKTEGLGNQRLQHVLDGNVKVFELTCRTVQWETEPGKRVEAWTYNGVVPGPEIRVTEGDRVRIHVKNELAESTAVHWHGLHTPNSMDGVPFVTQDPIKPGSSFTYEFVAKPAGSHMYHSHHNATMQVTMGLLGAFIVEPEGSGPPPEGRPRLHHDPQRWPARVYAQWQEFSGHRAAHCQGRPDNPGPLYE